ncbi:DNA ligase [Bradyrhizobium sp. JYMT SZCCT0428]|uniref:ATP-dependent DNA ligase n=1 Tax=Bradyrhizobium sp. JYMT SZCCT0428 TaxID=2807673 RepID=UPI002897E172|nr:DNA ligase [Bradyrhizobium sp. JYMT SZCCT0428]
MAARVPTGPDWFHEIKYDGYRLMLVRQDDRVRLTTKGGHDWSKRLPWIVETARQIRQKHFVLDGEGVVLGVVRFQRAALAQARRRGAVLCLRHAGRRRRRPPQAAAIDAKDQPSRLGCWRGAPRAFLSRPIEQVDVGTDLFRALCGMGLEGLISKHRERAYRAGRSAHWIKVKNRRHPATSREF